MLSPKHRPHATSTLGSSSEIQGGCPVPESPPASRGDKHTWRQLQISRQLDCRGARSFHGDYLRSWQPGAAEFRKSRDRNHFGH